MRLPQLTSIFLLACAPLLARADVGPSSAPSTVQGLCDALIAAMKEGPSASFAARVEALSPEVRKDFDLAAMTRIVVGPPWRGFSDAEKQDLVAAFSDYSVANYAQRFRSYSGERFVVDPAPTVQADGGCVVHSQLYTQDPVPVQLDYMMRLRDGRWRIIDVFLSGTISELAARRSEYSMALRTGGAPALVKMLRDKTAELGR